MEVWQVALYSACAIIAVRMTAKVALSYRARIRLERAIDIVVRHEAERKRRDAEQAAKAAEVDKAATERDRVGRRAA